MTETILSIVVPTFNRAPLLKILLDCISRELPVWPNEVELVVVDNASTDSTRDVVDDAVARGLPIRYIRNDENIGMDRNLAACFAHARGHYFWQIGDDEVLFNGAVQHVLEICRTEDFGIMHLASRSFVEGEQQSIFDCRLPAELDVRRTDRGTLFRRINVFLTFISANVVNRRAVLERVPAFNSSAELNTYLPQLSWIFAALRVCEVHLDVRTPTFGALTGNTGGYRLVEVFGRNLIGITERHLDGHIANARRIMANAALTRVIANEMRASSRNSPGKGNRFVDEDVRSAMDRCFAGRPYYHWLVAPMVFSTNRVISLAARVGLRILNGVNRRLGYRLL